MKNSVFLSFLLAISAFLMAAGFSWWTPMDTMYAFSNPIAGAFKKSFLDIETSYESDKSTLTYLIGSIGISTDALNLYVAPLLKHPMILEKVFNSEIDIKDILLTIPALASLKIANAIVISSSINAVFFKGNFEILDVPTIALGLGGETMNYKTYSAGALYYETSDLFTFDEERKITTNENFNWKNGIAGIYAYSKGLNSESYFNVSIDLPVIDKLSNEEGDNSAEIILNSLTGDLIASNGGVIFGGGWNRGSYYGLLGLDLKFLKIWAESFGGNGMEFFKSFLIKAKVTF